MEKNNVRETAERFAMLCRAAAEAQTLRSVVLHSPLSRQSEVQKIRGEVVTLAKGAVLQLESHLTEGRLTHENVQLEAIPGVILTLTGSFKKAELTCTGGTASLMINKKGDRATLLTHGQLTEGEKTAQKRNNREKKRLLTGGEPFLTEVGISDSAGRVRDKMQSKFRQINRFCEYIAEALEHLGGNGKLCILDLCCGKSYLSFAAYHTVTAVFGRECEMHCVDLKRSVIDYCAGVAERCAYTGMHFTCGDITEFTPPETPDMVISLHACDTATDIVLECAIKHRSKVVLSTPCCHHELNEKLSCDALSFIGKRPLLRQKLCSAATDALRLMRLEAAGYETDATELIDPEDTPKNIMLRGYLRKTKSEAKLQEAFEEYRRAYCFMYGYEPEPIVLNDVAASRQ